MDLRLPETVGDLRLTSRAPDLARVLRRPEEVLKLLPLASWGSAPYAAGSDTRLTDAYVLVLARDGEGVARVQLRFGSLAPDESLDLFRAPLLLELSPQDFDVEALVEALVQHRASRAGRGGGGQTPSPGMGLRRP